MYAHVDINELFNIAERGEMKNFFLEQNREMQEDIISEVFADLVGTCQGDSDSVLEEYGLSEEFLLENGFTDLEIAKIFDEAVKMCEHCGWWVSGQDGCEQCHEDEEEDEEEDY